ncbi:30S ribosomal protein S5p (S2e) [Candidatus Nasuia deltocephalinicola]|nr:30S ribosomal protein S5p (S2e) [Candidatus Nasuia deltocephalinicola]
MFLIERVIKVKKTFKSIKGVNLTIYTVIAVIGDLNGGIGLGKSKSSDQNFASYKAFLNARKNFKKIILKNGTIFHEIYGKCCSTKVILFPGRYGGTVLSGGCTRYIFEVIGINSIICKIYGSNNSWNVAKATIKALLSSESSHYVFIKRNKLIRDIF